MLEKIKNWLKADKWRTTFVIIVVVFILMALWGSTLPDDETSSNDSQTVEKKNETITLKMNEKTKVGDFNVYATPASTATTLVFNGRGWDGDEKTILKAEGEYIYVDVYAENIAKKSVENGIELEDAKLYVGDIQYSLDDNLMGEYRTDGRVFKEEDVNPGMNQMARFGFDVPVGTFDSGKPIYIQFKIDDKKYKLQVK